MRPELRLAAMAVVAISLAIAPGCGRNRPGMALSPSVLRPGPLVYTGQITGAVVFDTLNMPDLARAPFPPTRVELYDKQAKPARLLAVENLTAYSQVYTFRHVKPGVDSIAIISPMFQKYAITNLPASDGYLDAGIVMLTIDGSAVSSSMDVIGSIPGYTFDQLGMGTTTLIQNSLGVWDLSPTSFLFQPPPTIPAGTYRLKFVNSYASTATNLIGYGGSSADTLTVPIASHASVIGSGPATDLVVRFPTTGDYAFTFDERRQRFSIQPAPAPASPFARR